MESSSVMGAVLAISGATMGLAVGIILYIIINGSFKNPVEKEELLQAKN